MRRGRVADVGEAVVIGLAVQCLGRGGHAPASAHKLMLSIGDTDDRGVSIGIRHDGRLIEASLIAKIAEPKRELAHGLMRRGDIVQVTHEAKMARRCCQDKWPDHSCRLSRTALRRAGYGPARRGGGPGSELTKPSSWSCPNPPSAG